MSEAKGNGARVLLLDRRESSRVELGRQLQNHGYKPIGASDVKAAVYMARADEKLDYAVIDLDLGTEGIEEGLEAARMVARQRPGMPIVVLSDGELDQLLIMRLKRDIPQAIGYVWTMRPKARYMEDVLSELEKISKLKRKRTCFVIMPFSDTDTVKERTWTDIFESGIKAGVDRTNRYECARSSPLAGKVIEQIFDSLNSADVVVADLTDRNPNVFYELGVRHSLQDSTILLSQHPDKVPFDIRGFATIGYDWSHEPGREALRENVRKAIENVDDMIAKGRVDLLRSPVRKYTIPTSS